MSLRLEMIQVARLATSILSDSKELVSKYVKSQLLPDGSFRDRAGKSDLYYTVFGLHCLHILGDPIPVDETRQYLKTFGAGEDLDLVHLTALIQCWNSIGLSQEYPVKKGLELVESFRSDDGGYHHLPANTTGSAYSGFMALNAYLELGLELPGKDAFLRSIHNLQNADGSFSAEPQFRLGITTVTAAAVVVLKELSHFTDPATVRWLWDRLGEHGGFYAISGAPMPDLLSTATALHALSKLKEPLGPVKEICLDFMDSLWVNTGSFYGNWAEEYLDVEYTFYALLALGHLGGM